MAKRDMERFFAAWDEVQAVVAPTPSQFSDVSSWGPRQDTNPILCLRPPSAKGLPVRVLYEGFRQFLLHACDPNLNNITPEARLAAERLCNTMGFAYQTEAECAEAIDEALKPFWPTLISEFRVHALDSESSGRVDHSTIGILIEIKLEAGGSSKSAFMQICLCYRLYVESLKKAQGMTQNKFESAGYPTFLLTMLGRWTRSPLSSACPLTHNLLGPTLTIYGAFYDGRSFIIESLTGAGLEMLDDCTGERQIKLAKALMALYKEHRKIVDMTKCACYSSIPPHRARNRHFLQLP